MNTLKRSCAHMHTLLNMHTHSSEKRSFMTSAFPVLVIEHVCSNLHC